MASFKTGYGLPAGPSDSLRFRGGEEATPRGAIPRPMMHSSSSKERDVPRTARKTSVVPRVPFRPIQTTPGRGTVLPRPSRSIPEHQTAPTPRNPHEAYRSQRQAALAPTSSSAGKSSSGQASGSRGATGGARAFQLKPPRRIDTASNDCTSSDCSSSCTQSSQESMDSGLGIQYGLANRVAQAHVSVAEAVEIKRPSLANSPVIYPELDRYRDFQAPRRHELHQDSHSFPPLSLEDLPPATPASALFSAQSSQVSGSPSTKFSGSPGPGPYSRDTTPTSISSQSPILIAPSRIGIPYRNGRPNNYVATRPPITRRRTGSFPTEADSLSADPHGLAAVRESLTSSSSNSTVKEGEKAGKHEKRVLATRLPPPPPSPPPRKSSQKARKPKKGSDIASSKANAAKDVDERTQASKGIGNIGSPPRPAPASSDSVPPVRPSRQNTPDMKSQLFNTVPVIMSNLTSTTHVSDRRGNIALGSSSLPGSTTSLPQAQKNSSSSNLSVKREATPLSTSARSSSERAGKPEAETSSGSSATGNTRSSSRSRFAFFGRKKASSDNQDISKKVTRKGPVAGTGHEGYGRVGAVRKRSGSGGSNPRPFNDPLSSQESLSSRDSFLADRVNPVIISGGEIVENRNPSTELVRPESRRRPSTDSKDSSEASSTARNESSQTVLRRPMYLHGQNTASSSRRPSNSSGSDAAPVEDTIAYRRSANRLLSSPDSPLRLPKSINTTGTSTSPMTSLDASIMSDESYLELRRGPSHELGDDSRQPRKLKKKTRSPRKWNFFSRSRSQPNTKTKSENAKVTATVTTVENKPIPFYAMLDQSEADEARPVDIQDVLRDAEVYVHASPSLSGAGSSQSLPRGLEAGGVPDVPTKRSGQVDWHFPQDSLRSSGTISPPRIQTGASKPSRLPQVGRIPQVVKKRQENVFRQSFSRPFRASLLPPANPSTDLYDPESIATGPSPPKSSTPVPDLIMDGSTADGVTLLSSQGPGISPDAGRGDAEFLSFSPRKNSDVTLYTTSSSSGGNPFIGATAVIPRPDDPPAEDEVWDEYDDFLGGDGMKEPPSATSSKGTPFHLESYEAKAHRSKDTESPVVVTNGRDVSTYSTAPTRSSAYSADMTERIRAAFQPKASPTAAERPTAKPAVQAQSLEEPPSKRSSTSSCRTRFSDCSSCSSNDGSPAAQVNLRVGSMTVSKWLTFGHVLFSDIRHDLSRPKRRQPNLKHHSVLVIDGLGNDDWSFYAAETYPSATVFNLSPRAPLPPALKNSPSGLPLSPPNHHQVQYTSHMEEFPFPPHTFDAVVYRFPAAAPESHYRNILSEAKRVLRPGGYVELSILDADLNNMGNLGRRAIRRLKEKIHEQSPETSFASIADLAVRMLGTSGFDNIRAARVGVPVASSLTRSGSIGSRKSRNSDKKKDSPSLAEMMRDNSAVADENITRIVTRVGRWWYSRCYESASSSSAANESIWQDKQVLAECENMGTSLKFMVCCARTPDQFAPSRS